MVRGAGGGVTVYVRGRGNCVEVWRAGGILRSCALRLRCAVLRSVS